MISDEMRQQGAMLAQQSKTINADLETALSTLVRSGDWIFDLKWDGIRCLAYVDQGSIALINRRGVDITFRYPDVVEGLIEAMPTETAVLDGEIVCIGEDGRPDFARVHRRDAQQGVKNVPMLAEQAPAVFIAFDMIGFATDDLRRQPLRVRLALLRTLSEQWPDASKLMLSTHSKDGHKMWDIVKEYSLEGLIAKKETSVYRAGRANTWIKLKPTRRVTAMVSGVDEGKGWRADSFGALHLVLLGKAGDLVPIGRVGSGFTTQDLTLVQQHIASGVPLLIDVEYQEVSPDKQLRFPVFKGIRTDMTVLDCTIDQLEGAPAQAWR